MTEIPQFEVSSGQTITVIDHVRNPRGLPELHAEDR